MINQPKFLKVQDEPGLVRDTKNNAILANNLQEKKKYLELQKKELNISRIGEMNERIEKLENGVNEIKDMLKTLINNGRSS
jgi:predicted transcriptional regulator